VKIALIHDWLTGMRGGEKCLEILCRRFPDAQLFTLIHDRGSASPAIERMQIATSFLQRIPSVTKNYRYLLPLMPTAISRLEIPTDVGLIVSFSHAVAKSIKPPPNVPHVCYCFTPMRYAWDRRADYFRSSTTLHKAPIATARNVVLDWMAQWDRTTSNRVTDFVAISKTIAQRIAKCYDRPSRIVYPPVDTQFYTPSDLQREEFYLCVSALVPYKRIDLIIEACNRLNRQLIVIGEGPERQNLQRLAGPSVKLIGWQTNTAIRHYMRRARALLFAAHEDFGIVPVEAQACGTPVIVFGNGGATETVIQAEETNVGTGILFDQQSSGSISAAIQKLEKNPSWLDPKLARKQAERFSAQRFERELVAHLEKVVGKKLPESPDPTHMTLIPA